MWDLGGASWRILEPSSIPEFPTTSSRKETADRVIGVAPRIGEAGARSELVVSTMDNAACVGWPPTGAIIMGHRGAAPEDCGRTLMPTRDPAKLREKYRRRDQRRRQRARQQREQPLGGSTASTLSLEKPPPFLPIQELIGPHTTQRAPKRRSGPVPANEAPCVNCDRPFPPRRSLFYCSELCDQEAGYVRYHRRVLRDGRISRPDVREALEIRLAHLLNGGYPERQRHLSAELRAAIFERDGGRCRACGAPATDIDHIGHGPNGNVNHPDNLQALCAGCHRRKTLAALEIVTVDSDPELYAHLTAKAADLTRRRPDDWPLGCPIEQHRRTLV
jgi:5-methylcytosine-specific restriction endonuclease McrA